MKFLGITLDHRLTWKNHIDNLFRKIKSNLKKITRKQTLGYKTSVKDFIL